MSSPDASERVFDAPLHGFARIVAAKTPLIGLIALGVAVLALLFAPPSNATTSYPLLNDVAQRGHSQKIRVLCYGEDEKNSPQSMGAWGYVWKTKKHAIHLDEKVCEGALAISHPNPLILPWQMALGAEVLAHESYHLSLNLSDRLNEGKTECRAMRHFKYYVQFLGGSAALANELLIYALVAHFQLTIAYPEYQDNNCILPHWEPGG